MTDQPQAQEPAEGNQQSPMPSEEQQTQSVDETSPQGESPEPSLPDGVKERTSQEFEKLKKQLAEEREKRLSYERVISTGVNQPKEPQEAPQQDWYDPDSNTVDVNTLTSKLTQLEQQNQQLSSNLQRYVSSQDEKQARAAYKVHPDLDPNNDQFNEEFHNAVVGYLSTQYAAGKNPTLKQAASTVKGFGAQQLKEAEKQGASQALEKLSPKEQAGLETSDSRSDRRNQAQGTLDELRTRTRTGDEAAIRERLQRLSSVGS